MSRGDGNAGPWRAAGRPPRGADRRAPDRGWFRRDYDEYGYDFGTKGSRLDDLGAALPRIESRWAALRPAPVRDIPVLIGGGGERKTLRYVARHAHLWHYFMDAQTYRHKSAVLAEHCRAEGRDPAEIERCAEVGSESIDQMLRRAEEMHAEGVTLFTVGVDGPDYPVDAARALVRWRDRG